MGEITTVGLDLAKNVFQVHAIDGMGKVLARRRLGRSEVLDWFRGLPPCLVGVEACASAHHWGREIAGLGHTVRLMPAGYVKPYVKRGKTDAADAEAICEAVTRPTMRFVAVKSADQQAALMLHKVRDLLVRQRTMLINALRGHMGEFGIVGAAGAKNVPALVARLHETQDELPPDARAALHLIVDGLRDLDAKIQGAETRIIARHRANEASRRLATIPGVGPITASAIAATVQDASRFPSGRHFAAWLGLTPQPNSSGGKDRLGGISKQGGGHLRRLLVTGATAVIRFARAGSSESKRWAAALLERKPARVATVALANKTARIVWVLLTRNQSYAAPASAAA